MRAIFLTKKDAVEYVNSHYDSPEIRETTSDNGTEYDIDEIPFSWDGVVNAYEVNGVDIVAYYEEERDYTIRFRDTEEHINGSLHEAREMMQRMVDVAEDNGFEGNVTLSEDSEEIDSEEAYPLGEPSDTDFAKIWERAKTGMKIRKVRESRGLSIRKLAELCGMSKNNVERIENGKYNYTIDNLNVILKALDLDLSIK